MPELDRLDTRVGGHPVDKKTNHTSVNVSARASAESIQSYSDSLRNVMAEVDRVGGMVKACARRAKDLQANPREIPGVCVLDHEIDELVEPGFRMPVWATTPASTPRAFDEQAPITSKAESARTGIRLRLSELADNFQLDRLALDILLLCLAPELDPKYERLYAYLQDDITRKHPTVDLVLNILSPTFEDRLAGYRHFCSTAPLRRHELLQLTDDPWHPQAPFPRRALKINDRIVSYLLGSDDLDPALRAYARHVDPQICLKDLILPAFLKERLHHLQRTGRARENRAIVYLQGPYGVGKQATAGALCHDSGRGLLRIDLELLQHKDKDEAFFERLFVTVGREARLRQASLYCCGFDLLFNHGEQRRREIVLRTLADLPGTNFLAGTRPWEGKLPEGLRFVPVAIPLPSSRDRTQLWSTSLSGASEPEKTVASLLANQFRMSGGQIRDALATAENLADWHGYENGQIPIEHLYAACRQHSSYKLESLAQRILPRYCWQDIILPPEQLGQLREVCDRMTYRTKVYDDWGFDHKLSLGKALNVLFAGPSGTGKTMAAEIMSHELRLDLYKIDLSTVVSKYIGETEKNLSGIFAAAESSNAILFFDEADALFGKRSEVRNSHDRYANLEISYLLQRMEAYEGIAILATNLRKNMDDAFLRRLHFIIEFPFPGPHDRQRIWSAVWPEQVPRSADLDTDFLANRFELSGGSIRNVALAAAFEAASTKSAVSMEHLLHGVRREYQKMGKVSAADHSCFGQERSSPPVSVVDLRHEAM